MEEHMREELRQIDVSAIAELVRIKEQEEILRERLAKMEAGKAKVSQVVYRRVREDYETRQAALDAESHPLKERARTEYAKLCVLRGEAERAVEDASLQKEELEFRRDLGEFEDDQFRDGLAECEKRLSDRKQELAEILQLKEQFLKAFHSEEELELPAVVELPRREPVSGEETVVRPYTPVSPPAPALSPDATVMSSALPSQAQGGVPPSDVTIPTSKAAVASSAPASATGLSTVSATVMLSLSRVIRLVNNEPAEEYVLKPGANSIGRSPKNDIQVPQSEVSRRHANIILSDEGCRIVDLGSENGVYVNGERVQDRPLANGDLILVGTQKLVYKE